MSHIFHPNSPHLKEWLDNIKIAEKVLDELNSYDQLLNTNNKLTKLINIKNEFDEEKAIVNNTIKSLKEYLRLNLTSDLAPLILDQIKLLQAALKKENLRDLNSSKQIAEEFIYKTFLEPEEKIKEEKRIAEQNKRIAGGI